MPAEAGNREQVAVRRAAREREIVALRARGVSVVEIAARYRISHQRAVQIVKRDGAAAGELARARRAELTRARRALHVGRARERAGLAAAGLQAPAAPGRVYAPVWHVAACWRALLSVADQLGDPPRYERYLALAAEREDLPSGATVRQRLGLWSQIARALSAHTAPTAVSADAGERERRAA